VEDTDVSSTNAVTQGLSVEGICASSAASI